MSIVGEQPRGFDGNERHVDIASSTMLRQTIRKSRIVSGIRKGGRRRRRCGLQVA